MTNVTGFALADDKCEYKHVKKILSLAKKLDVLTKDKDTSTWNDEKVEEVCDKIDQLKTPTMKIFDEDMVKLENLSMSGHYEDLLFVFPTRLYEEDTKLQFKSPIWSYLFHKYYEKNFGLFLDNKKPIGIESFVYDYLGSHDFASVEVQFLKAYEITKYGLEYPLSILAM